MSKTLIPFLAIAGALERGPHAHAATRSAGARSRYSDADRLHRRDHRPDRRRQPRLGDAARIAGSHVILFAGKDPLGRPALASAIVTDGNPSGRAADGSYATGSSDREVVILRWQGSKTTIVFRRPQPSA